MAGHKRSVQLVLEKFACGFRAVRSADVQIARRSTIPAFEANGSAAIAGYFNTELPGETLMPACPSAPDVAYEVIPAAYTGGRIGNSKFRVSH